LRDGTVNYCGSFDEYLFSNISNVGALFPQGFAASVSFPIPGFGGVITMFQKPLHLTAQIELFFKSIGALLGMYFAKVSVSVNEGGVAIESQPAELLTLTKRQWEILNRIREGLTNNEIALQLAYSESTIRHETMRIYEKLKVNGRKDLLSPDFVMEDRQIG
jgi:DNA-binding CsgD family transcriptional regulator